jgi:hypothetical protein
VRGAVSNHRPYRDLDAGSWTVDETFDVVSAAPDDALRMDIRNGINWPSAPRSGDGMTGIRPPPAGGTEMPGSTPAGGGAARAAEGR